MSFWVPMKAAIDDLPGAVSAELRVDPQAVEAVATRTETLAADLIDDADFKKVPVHVSTVRLGDYGHAGEVAELHTLAHTIVSDVLTGVNSDLLDFAHQLKLCVADAEDQDSLNATVLNAIAGVQSSHRAEQAGQQSRNENLPTGGESS
ncbi:hypothetical protein ACLM5J_08790 [Nocardioides sp. Bht2]|uniref:hypothetical protein n=1 Tax=Nocardioides sp. Bht2 TaxID=3392297 RepID=UPI0039B62C71